MPLGHRESGPESAVLPVLAARAGVALALASIMPRSSVPIFSYADWPLLPTCPARGGGLGARWAGGVGERDGPRLGVGLCRGWGWQLLRLAAAKAKG